MTPDKPTEESEEHSELFNRTPGCDGEIVTLWSGVKCNKCGGWFCF